MQEPLRTDRHVSWRGEQGEEQRREERRVKTVDRFETRQVTVGHAWKYLDAFKKLTPLGLY